MITNYQGIKFETKGIDLATYNKEELINRFSHLEVPGIYVLLLIYEGPITNKTKSGLYLSTPQNDGAAYYNYTGLVLQVGRDAYKGVSFPSGAYCKVGDWVIFPRAASLQIDYEDEPIVMVEDINIKLRIDDPSKVSK